MVRRKAPLQAQNQHRNSSHESSAGIKFSAREYYNQRFEKIDKNHRSTTLYADTTNFHIDRIEGLWRTRSVSFNVPSLMIVLRSSFSRYCEVVNIDPYHTLKKSTEGRIKNFFHWLCNNYSVKKISLVKTYWHQLSQLYIKWKGRRINPLSLKQIFDVSGKNHRCSDMADKEIVHQRFARRRTRPGRQRNRQASLGRGRLPGGFALPLGDGHKHLSS